MASNPQQVPPLSKEQRRRANRELKAQQTPVGANAPEDPDEQFDEALDSPGGMYDFWKGVDTAMEVDWIGPALADGVMKDEEVDPEYRTSKQEWEKHTKGIPVEYQDRLTDVRSLEQLKSQSKRIRKEMRMEKELSKAGWEGQTGRILAGMLDPTAIGAAAMSEGIAAPMVLSTKVGRMTRAIRAATVGGATEAGLEASTLDSRPTKDYTDVLWAGAFGAALTGPFGAFANPRSPDAQWAKGSKKVADQVDAQKAQKEIREAAEEYRTQTVDDLDAEIADRERSVNERETEVQTAQRNLDEARNEDSVDSLVQRVEEVQGKTTRSDTTRSKRNRETTIARSLDDPNARAFFESMDLKVPSRGTDTVERGDGSSGSEVTSEARSFARSVTGKTSRQKRLNIDNSRKQVDDLQQQRDAEQAELDEMRRERDRVANASPEELESVAQERLQGFAQRSSDGPRPDAPDAPEFDSAGAVRADELTQSGVIDGNSIEEITANPMRGRFDPFYLTQKSDSDILRHLGQMMLSDPVGPRTKGDQGNVANISGAEIADRLKGLRLSRVLHQADQQWKAYVKRHANSPFRSKRMEFDEDQRARFMDDVTRYMWTQDANAAPEVKATGDRIAEQYKEILRDAKRFRLKGFEDIDESVDYVPRIWQGDKIVSLENNGFADKGDIEELIKNSILRGSDDLDPEDADDINIAGKMAGAVYKRFKQKGEGVDMDFNQAFFGRDLEAAQELLRDVDTPEEAIEELMSHLKKKDDGEKAGAVGYAKKRIRLDPTTTYFSEATQTQLSIDMLLETNASSLFSHYARRMSGEIAMAKKFREDGVEGQINPMMEVKKRLRQAKRDGATDGEVDRVRAITNIISGKPPYDNMNQPHHVVARWVRDYNYIRMMGQTGFAVPAEMGMALGQAGTYMVRNLPQIKSIMKRNERGEVDHQIAAEYDRVGAAFGSEHLLFRSDVRADDFGLSAPNPKMQKTERFLENAKQGVSMASGLRPLTNGLQRVFSVSLTQKFMDLAEGRKVDANGYVKLSQADRSRIRDAGLSDDMLERVFKEFDNKKGPVESPSGKTYKTPQLHKWEDLEARDAFIGAVHKWTNRVAMRNLDGELPPVLNNPWVGLLTQFRTFVMNSYSKILAHGVKMNDFYTWSGFMGSTLLSSVTYTGQQMVNSLGKEDPQKFLEDRLSPQNLALSSIQRSSWASLLPAFIDTAAAVSPFTDEAIFPYGRTTGQATAFFEGNPSVDLADSFVRSLRAGMNAPLRDDYDFSQEDMRAVQGITAFQNLTGVRNVMNFLEQDLPRTSTDQR